MPKLSRDCLKNKNTKIVVVFLCKKKERGKQKMQDSFFGNSFSIPKEQNLVETIEHPKSRQTLLVYVDFLNTLFLSVFSDTWRFMVSFAIASIIHVFYTWMPIQIVSFVISVVLLYKFGQFSIIKTQL